jgi:flagellar hook assembly protein FlgD
VIYRQDECESGVPQEMVVANVPAVLMNPQPNPFTHETRVEYVVASPGVVSLSVYNVQGQEVAGLADGPVGPGSYTVTWEGRADDGSPAAAGVYFVRMTAGTHSSTKRLILSR